MSISVHVDQKFNEFVITLGRIFYLESKAEFYNAYNLFRSNRKFLNDLSGVQNTDNSCLEY
jgi:hypothetical protein